MHRLARTTCLTLAFAAFSTNCLGEWPEFRGPFKNGISPQTRLPTSWSQNNNIRWRRELPGQGWSSPVVVEGAIFVTAAIPSENSGYDLTLLRIDGESGSIVWQQPLFQQPSSAPAIHRKNSHASPTPIFDGEHLFLHFGHQGTACVSLSGDVVWKNSQLSYEPVHGNGGSPAVVGELLIFSRDGRQISEITALDRRSGNIIWQTERDVEVQRKFSFCTPLVFRDDQRTQLILPGSNVVQSVDPTNGQELWRFRYDGYSVIPRPIYHAGLVYVCTGYNKPSLLAIDPSGSGDVTSTHLKWRTDDNIPHTPSLVAREGAILCVSDRGIASSFDAISGQRLWFDRMGGNFSASPLLAGSDLFLLSEDGVCTVLDLSKREPEIKSKNAIGERCLASLAVLENDLLLRSADALYRISVDR